MNRAIIVFLALIILISTASAALHKFCPNDNNLITEDTNFYSTLECAVGDSGNDGVIQIGANDITLDCNGMTMIGGYEGRAIYVGNYDNVTIKNCNIGAYYIGILGNSADDLNIFDNNIQMSSYGLYLAKSKDGNIYSNFFDNNNNTALYVLNDANSNSITDNNISDNNKNGITLNKVGDLNFSRNEISYNGTGETDNAGVFLSSSNTTNITFSDNNFVRNNNRGITFNTYSSNHTIKDNNFYYNCQGGIISLANSEFSGNEVTGSQWGYYSGGSGNHIHDNNFRANLTAISILNSVAHDNNVYRNNIDANNKTGISISADANRNTISDNNISDNNAHGIYLTRAGDINIFNNEISYNGRAGSNDGAIYIKYDAGDINVHDNNLSWNNRFGLHAEGGRNFITDNNISSNFQIGIYLTYANYSADNNVLCNLIADNTHYGIFASDPRNKIADNNIRSSQYGIYLTSSSATDINIYRNIIDQNNAYGIWLQTAAASNSITDNNISDNNTEGIRLQTAAKDINVRDNNISFNGQYGIFADGAFDLNITDNNISYNADTGLYTDAPGNVDINLTNNTLKNNTSNDIYLEDTNIVFLDGNYGTIAFADINANMNRRFYVDVNIVSSLTNTTIIDVNLDINTQRGELLFRIPVTTTSPTQLLQLPHFDQNTNGKYNTSLLFNAVHGCCDTNAYSAPADANKTITLYLSPNGVGIISPTPRQTINTQTITFSYLASANFQPVSKYWIKFDNDLMWTDNGTATNIIKTLSAGDHLFYVKATDPNDINSQQASVAFKIELGTAAPLGCGDNTCSAGESAITCPSDCGAVCGDGACTHTEGPQTCPEDCGAYCGDGICGSGETCSSCENDCGFCPIEDTPLKTIITQTQTTQATEEQINATLTEAGFSIDEITQANEATAKINVTKNIFVVQNTETQQFSTEITLYITNTTGAILKNVRILEKIPKEVAQSADEITSEQPFSVIKEDPIIQFTFSEVAPGKTAEAKYSLAKNTSEEHLALFAPPIPTYAIEASAATCTTVHCNDRNPCTRDICFDGECAYILEQDGTTCGFGKVCQEGVCRGKASSSPYAAGTINTNTILLIITLVAAALAAAFAYKKMKK